MNEVVSGAIRKAGWLLTPFVAGAAAFLGAWLGAFARLKWTPESASFMFLVIGGGVFSVIGTIGWALLLKRADPAEPRAADQQVASGKKP